MECELSVAGLCFSSLGLIACATVLITSKFRRRALDRIVSNLEENLDDLRNIQQNLYTIESAGAKDITPREPVNLKQLPPPK